MMKNTTPSLFMAFILATIIFAIIPAQSYIQLETGQLFHQMVDFELNNGVFPLIISRQYQQIKSGNSILGDRWCFDFEQQMRAENGGYRLYSCGTPTPVFFTLKGKKLSFENEVLFEKPKGGLLRRTGKNTTLVYNERGYLIAKKRSGFKKIEIKIAYDKENRPNKISYLNKYLLEIKFDAKGKASGIFLGRKKVVNYVVTNNKLVSEKNGWNIEHQFEYNSSGLLSRIKYPDSTTEKFSYKKETKTVEDYVSQDGCVRKFNYILDNAKSTARISVNDSCVKQPPLQITLRRSKIFRKNRVELEAEKNKAKKNQKMIVQRDQFNRVQKIENEKFLWTIGYDSKTGHMRLISENVKGSKQNKVYQVIYKLNKIVEISELGRSKINFVYSSKGKLLRVRSTAKPEERLLMMTKVDNIRAIIGESKL